MLTEYISEAAVAALKATGYAGACLLMAMESMIFPIPSEAVMPFVGFLVADGQWTLSGAILATTLGSILGSWISYEMGRRGGRPFVLRVGRYFLLDLHDLEITERFFHKNGGRSGAWVVFISRFVPVVRHLISIPAGVGQMPLPAFLTLTAVGATMWNGFLLWCGFALRDNWGLVQKYTHEVDIAALICVSAAGGWFIAWKRKCRRQSAAAAACACEEEKP